MRIDFLPSAARNRRTRQNPVNSRKRRLVKHHKKSKREEQQCSEAKLVLWAVIGLLRSVNSIQDTAFEVQEERIRLLVTTPHFNKQLQDQLVLVPSIYEAPHHCGLKINGTCQASKTTIRLE